MLDLNICFLLCDTFCVVPDNASTVLMNGSAAHTLQEEQVPQQCDKYSLFGPDDQNVDPYNAFHRKPNFGTPGDVPKMVDHLDMAIHLGVG